MRVSGNFLWLVYRAGSKIALRHAPHGYRCPNCRYHLIIAASFGQPVMAVIFDFISEWILEICNFVKISDSAEDNDRQRKKACCQHSERIGKMKYGYTIIYVRSVEESLDFYKRAFGFEAKFLLDSKAYGELATGETTLAFASYELGDVNLAGKYLKANIHDMPLGMELSFVTEDVQAAFSKAVASGAVPIKEPEKKPWGQVVSYVRALEGTLIELASPISE
jgi:lactoylglutathione lyase